MGAPPLPQPGTPLTDRERQVLTLIAAGCADKEVSTRLYLTQNTVKTHVRRLCARLGARSRAHAVAIALRAQVIR